MESVWACLKLLSLVFQVLTEPSSASVEAPAAGLTSQLGQGPGSCNLEQNRPFKWDLLHLKRALQGYKGFAYPAVSYLGSDTELWVPPKKEAGDGSPGRYGEHSGVTAKGVAVTVPCEQNSEHVPGSICIPTPFPGLGVHPLLPLLIADPKGSR